MTNGCVAIPEADADDPPELVPLASKPEVDAALELADDHLAIAQLDLDVAL